MWSIPATHPTIMPHSSRITVVTKLLGSHNHHQTTCRRKIFLARFSCNPYSGMWTLHQDRRSLSSPPAGAKISRNRSLMRIHAQSNAPACEGPWQLLWCPDFTTRVACRRSTSLCPWFSDPTPASPSFVHFSLRRHILSDSFLFFVKVQHH